MFEKKNRKKKANMILALFLTSSLNSNVKIVICRLFIFSHFINSTWEIYVKIKIFFFWLKLKFREIFLKIFPLSLATIVKQLSHLLGIQLKFRLNVPWGSCMSVLPVKYPYESIPLNAHFTNLSNEYPKACLRFLKMLS